MYLHESHLLKISDWCGPNFFKLATSVYLDSHDALISCLFKIWVSCLLAGMSLLKRRGTKNATSPNNIQIVLFHQIILKHVFISKKKKKKKKALHPNHTTFYFLRYYILQTLNHLYKLHLGVHKEIGCSPTLIGIALQANRAESLPFVSIRVAMK